MGEEIQTIEPAATPITGPEPARGWTDEETVEYLADRNWSISRIARKTGIERRRVALLVEAIDERRIEEIIASGGRRKARYVAHNQAVSEAIWEAVEKGANPRLLKIAMEAQSQTIKVLGDYAPTQTVNVEWKAHALVNPEVQARIMADPAARAALLALEEFAATQHAAIGPPEGGGG